VYFNNVWLPRRPERYAGSPTDTTSFRLPRRRVSRSKTSARVLTTRGFLPTTERERRRSSESSPSAIIAWEDARFALCAIRDRSSADCSTFSPLSDYSYGCFNGRFSSRLDRDVEGNFRRARSRGPSALSSIFLARTRILSRPLRLLRSILRDRRNTAPSASQPLCGPTLSLALVAQRLPVLLKKVLQLARRDTALELRVPVADTGQ